MLKIGNVELNDRPLLLAPMEDVTDPSFRHICKKYGAEMMYTEFVPSEALIRDVKKSLKKLEIFEQERPIGIQLYGHLLESMVEAAKIVETARPDVIDINFGCPVRKIANRGAGAGMLRNIPLLIKMTEEIVKAVSIPVTVKTRLGWDESDKPIVALAEQLQDVGVQAITIHGRTRSQLYRGQADWQLIGEVKNNPRMTIPVIGNGDITTPQEALEAFNRYGVDAIMIGRAAIGKPWLFRSTRHYLDTGVLLPDIGLEEKVELAREQFYRAVEWKGYPRGVFEMRRHFVNYFKGLPDFKEIRLKLVTAMEIEEIMALLDLIRERYPDAAC